MTAMRVMLAICDKFAIDFDLKFNTSKSVAMRVGNRFDVTCAPLTLSGGILQFAKSIKYLGICVMAAKTFKCSFEQVKAKFFRTFNAIYSRSKWANSELVSVQLLKSYCLPFMLYATEAIPLSRSSVNMLDNCVNVALHRIFGVSSSNANIIRQYVDLPLLQITIEKRRLKFLDKVSSLADFKTVLQVFTLDLF